MADDETLRSLENTLRVLDSEDNEIASLPVPATLTQEDAEYVINGVIADQGPGMTPAQLQDAMNGGMTYEEVMELSPALAMMMNPDRAVPDVDQPMDIYGTVYCSTKRLFVISANAWHFGVAFTLDERLAPFLRPEGNHILTMSEVVQVKRGDGAMEQIMRASMLCSTILGDDPVELPLIDIRFRDWVTLPVPDRMRQTMADGSARKKVEMKMAPADFLPDKFTNVTEDDIAAWDREGR